MILSEHRLALRFAYIFSAMQGHIDSRNDGWLSRLFSPNKLQVKTMITGLKTSSGEELVNRLPDRNQIEFHMHSASQWADTAFKDFVTGELVLLKPDRVLPDKALHFEE